MKKSEVWTVRDQQILKSVARSTFLPRLLLSWPAGKNGKNSARSFLQSALDTDRCALPSPLSTVWRCQPPPSPPVSVWPLKFASGVSLIRLIPVAYESLQRELRRKDSPFTPVTVP